MLIFCMKAMLESIAIQNIIVTFMQRERKSVAQTVR